MLWRILGRRFPRSQGNPVIQSSGSPWVLIDIDIQDACDYFTKSVALFSKRGFDKPGMEGFEATMALMHSMQCGHTSLENGLVRILRLLGESFAKEEHWHHDLIVQCGADIADRGAILDEELAKHAQTTRAFRNIATRQYRRKFDPELGEDAIRAAAVLANRLPACLEAFKLRVDPPGDKPPENKNEGGGDGSGGTMSGGPR